jgi:hypothetical protein
MCIALLVGSYVFIKNHFLKVARQKLVLQQKTELFPLLESTEYWLGTLEISKPAGGGKPFTLDYGLTWGKRDAHSGIDRLKDKIGDMLPTRKFHESFYFDGFVSNFGTTGDREEFFDNVIHCEGTLEHDADEFAFLIADEGPGENYHLKVTGFDAANGTLTGTVTVQKPNGNPTAKSARSSGKFTLKRTPKEQWNGLALKKRLREVFVAALTARERELITIEAGRKTFPVGVPVYLEYSPETFQPDTNFAYQHMIADRLHTLSLTRNVTGKKRDDLVLKDIQTYEYVANWRNESFPLLEDKSPSDALILTGSARNIQSGWSSLKLSISRSGEIRLASGVFRFGPAVPGLDVTLRDREIYKITKVYSDSDAARLRLVEGDSFRPEGSFEGVPNEKLLGTYWTLGTAMLRGSIVTNGGGLFSSGSLGLELKGIEGFYPIVHSVREGSNAFGVIPRDSLIIGIDRFSTYGQPEREVKRWMEAGNGTAISVAFVPPKRLEIVRDRRSSEITNFNLSGGVWKHIEKPGYLSAPRASSGVAGRADNLPPVASGPLEIAEALVRTYYSNDPGRSEGKFLAFEVDDYGTKKLRGLLIAESARYDLEYPFRETEIRDLRSVELSNGDIATTARLNYRRGQSQGTAGEFLLLTNVITTHVQDGVPLIVRFASDPQEKTVTCRFVAKIGPQDGENSKGVAFGELVRTKKMKFDDAVKEMLLMDRINFYKFGKRDPEDQPADYFAVLGDSDKTWEQIRASKLYKVRNSKLVMLPDRVPIIPGETTLAVEIIGNELRVTVR